MGLNKTLLALIIANMGLSSGRAYYTGALATRAFFPDTLDTSRFEYMTETMHIVRASSSVIGIVEGNSYAGTNNGEVGAGAPMIARASVSRSPTGSRTQITYGGQASGTIPNNMEVESDLVPFPVVKGDVIYIRRWRSCASGIVANADTIKGGSDICYRGTTTADLTMDTAAMTGGVAVCSWPLAVIGTIRDASVGIIGDSRPYGRGDTIDAAYEVGEVARSIGAEFGYINTSRRTMSPAQYNASNAIRTRLLKYITHIVSDFGINAFINEAKTYLQAKAELESTWAGFPVGKPIYQTTLTPVSSGAWTLADGSDQTVQWGDRLPQLNEYIRTNPAPLTGYFEIADQVESARNSGKWKAPAYTVDGAHGSQTAALAIKNSGAINTSVIFMPGDATFTLKNSRIAGAGDSRTDQLSYGSVMTSIGANTNSFWLSVIDQASNSPLAWLEALSGSRYRTWVECAKGGTSSTYHATKMIPQAIASGAGTVVYVGNVNDPANGVTKAMSISNIASVVAQCKSAGVMCILLTDPSGSNTPSQSDFHGTSGINEYILAQHDVAGGVIVIEIRDLFLTKTGESYLPWTALSDAYYDNPAIHWSIPAARRVALRIKSTLDTLALWDAALSRPADGRNIIANANFATATGGTLGTNNTGVLPSGAVGQSSNVLGPVAWSVNSRGDGTSEIVGTVTRTEGTSSLRRHEVAWTITPATSGIALGDYIQAGALVTLDAGHSKVVGTHVMTDISYTGGPAFEQGYKMLASTSNGVYAYPSGVYEDIDVRSMAHKTNALATGFGTCKIRAGIQTNGDCTVTFRIRLPYCVKLLAGEFQAEFETFATAAAFPAISGTATVGSVVTCTNTNWIANSVPTFTYQWFRTTTNASAGVAIAGATSSTYTLVSGDIGYKAFCKVYATTSLGVNEVETALTATIA